ncbi:MBL fold metallo-hydrolase [Cupriavidus sp. USMAA2-4]|uniref:MBL fold metallo-hydrolase n=1 Tax=Cupriavidus malaysiensis TaxID=367825 RepID=A0ABN4TJN8_9BURK|nr:MULTISPECIES: MBL fold metallo-hydrolase [Cupriavidus]AOY92192.1 MBL fold metallo-hydrolase [Cupriavidus sp. USMAA2-4]AOY98238.1 MBL fold metallo-hydrolase [Cupriavidus sp. USMAHM13]AOZ04666.1 MBL fold metallo-hydrolase [Cupriavidus malaysiensis]
MMQSRTIGDLKVTRILEYAGPTHDPAFLFPDIDRSVLDANAGLMAPHHWIPHMNKLIVTIQFWVVHAGNHIIVVDTGVGNFKPRPGIARMNMLNTLVREWMTAAGAPPERVTHVVMTHLHADHVGWNTTWQDNRWVPTFPNARYYIPKDDFVFCEQGRNKEPGVVDVFGESFFDSVMPVVNEGLAEMIVPGQEIADCLQVEDAAGHSPGQVAFRVRSRGEEAVFCGDILHSPLQIVRPDVNSGYCIRPDLARSTRLGFLHQAADSGALVLPVHFGEPYCGYVRREGQGFRFEPAGW